MTAIQDMRGGAEFIDRLVAAAANLALVFPGRADGNGDLSLLVQPATTNAARTRKSAAIRQGPGLSARPLSRSAAGTMDCIGWSCPC